MGTGKLTKIGLPASPKMVAGLQELIPVGLGDEKPEVTGYYDARGKVRRITADYPNGWRVRVNFNAQGVITSESAQLKLSCTIGAAA